MSDKKGPMLFNSALETGVRSVVLLSAAAPRAFDLTHLTWLDHLVVHTQDIGGPESLHPDIPQRGGELVVRRQLVEEGLGLMGQLHLIDANYDTNGILYSAREEAEIFVQLVRTPYGVKLKERARWLIEYVSHDELTSLATLIKDRVGRWAVEFQSTEKGH